MIRVDVDAVEWSWWQEAIDRLEAQLKGDELDDEGRAIARRALAELLELKGSLEATRGKRASDAN